MNIHKQLKFLALITAFLPVLVHSENIEVKIAENESFIMDVNKEDTIEMIKKNIADMTGYPVENQSLSIELSKNEYDKTYSGHRNYYEEMTASDQKDLHFIMKSLALKSLLELAKNKSKLEKAGDHIDHLHPLNFLAAIFSDEELKAYMHAIKKRGSWVWDKFMSGLTSTLSEEAKLNNMSLDFLQDFANRLGIDIQLILPSIEKKDWNELVKVLIVNLPRDGDADRYDM